jgi:transaldolase
VTTLDTLFATYGQSPWIDDAGRDSRVEGKLAHLVSQGVRGAVFSVSGFTRSLVGGFYDEAIHGSTPRDCERLYESLAALAARDGCDVLRDVYQRSREDFSARHRRYCDGFVAIEMAPNAGDSAAILAGARRLSEAVQRENLLIGVAASPQGLEAIPQILALGIGVNVTAIFSTKRYLEVLSAWKSGMEFAISRGRDLSAIGCVTSLALSPIDAVIDSLLAHFDQRRGTAGAAQAAAVYEKFRICFDRRVGVSLLAQGAQVPRPMWTSTSPANRDYFGLLYVNFLAGDETVTAMSDATLARAFDHGDFTKTLLATKRTVRKTAVMMKDLPRTIMHAAVASKLERDFQSAAERTYDEMISALLAKTGR